MCRDYYPDNLGYLDDYSPEERECPSCEDNSHKIDACTEHVKEIVKLLYNRNNLDKLVLEDSLDELCHVLGMKLPSESLNIQRSVV